MPFNSLASELNVFIQDQPEQTAYYVRSLTHPEQQIGHREHALMHIGSSFKALVAGTVCKTIEAGTLHYSDQIPITVDEILPDSIGTKDDPVRHLLTIEEALKLMIGVSDNTTTEMLMRRVNTQTLVDQLGLKATLIPPLLSDFINRALNEDATWVDYSPQASMIDLVDFYKAVNNPNFFASSATYDHFWEIMHEEDRLQAPKWGEGVMCYRKSGFLELNGFYGVCIAGIFKKGETGFAFALAHNVQFEQEDMASEVQQTVGKLASLLLRGLNQQLVT